MLLKGTTHRIIEVRGEKDCFFEKAVLYLRPDCSDRSPDDIKSEAQFYASRLSGDISGKNDREERIQKILAETFKALLVSALTLLAVLIYLE